MAHLGLLEQKQRQQKQQQKPDREKADVFFYIALGKTFCFMRMLIAHWMNVPVVVAMVSSQHFFGSSLGHPLLVYDE